MQNDEVEVIMNKQKVTLSHSSSPEQPKTLPDDAVLFNPLHDHESLWWIACWALLHYIPADHNPESDENLHERIEFARWIFHPTVRATCKLRGDRYSKESGESIKTKQSSKS